MGLVYKPQCIRLSSGDTRWLVSSIPSSSFDINSFKVGDIHNFYYLDL